MAPSGGMTSNVNAHPRGLDEHVYERDELEALRRRIVADHAGMTPPRSTWLWCDGSGGEHNGIAGFLGTAPIIVTALIPATGHGSNWGPYEFLFDCLREYGLEGAHLTDLFKGRATNEGAPAILHDPEAENLNRDYFLEEVRIVRPVVVVALGGKALDVLRRWGRWSFEVVPAPHPAGFRWPLRAVELKERLRRGIQKARELLDDASTKGGLR